MCINGSFFLFPLGSGNGAIVLALRGGRQEGGRRARRTTTSTTTTTTSTTKKSTTTSSSTLISFGEDVAQPAALLAPEEETWSVSSSTTSNLPFSFPSSGVSTSYASRPVSTKPHLELVVKPHSKVILPCELEGNYSRLLLSGSRYVFLFLFYGFDSTQRFDMSSFDR